MEYKKPSGLTIVFADPAPMIHMQEPCGHRRVTIKLTPEQAEALKMGRTSIKPEWYEFPTVFILE